MATTDRRGATVSATDPPIATNPSPDLAIKAPARAATTGTNIALTGLIALDGLALAAGDRVLVKDQADPTTNGLYNASSGVWTRTIDGNNNSQWTTGTLVTVTAGTANSGKTYELTTVAPVLGTSAMTFSLVTIAAGAFVGDSGTGGAQGLVPAPPAGSAAEGKFLSAAGDWEQPAGGGAGSTEFATKATLQGATLAGTVTSVRIAGYLAAGDGGGALYKTVGSEPSHGGKIQTSNGIWCELAEPVLDARMFGAFGAADDSAALQLWVDCPVSAVKRMPAHVRIDTASLNITSPCKIVGGGGDFANTGNSASRITTTSDTLDLIWINSDNVEIIDVDFPGLGSRQAANKGRAIVIGQNYAQFTDGVVSGTAIASTSATFTGAGGQPIAIDGAGTAGARFFTTIASVTDAHHAVLSQSAPTSVNPATFRFGKCPVNTILTNLTIAAHSIGVHVVNGANFHFDNCEVTCFDGILCEDLVSSDKGDAEIVFCDVSADATSGTCIKNKSGGGLRITCPKCLVGLDHIVMDWSWGISGGILLEGGSLEGASRSSFRVTGDGTAQIIGIKVNDVWINGAPAPIVFDDGAGTGFIKLLEMSGLTITSSSAAALVTIGKSVTTFVVNGGIYDGNSFGGATAFSVPHSGPVGSILFPVLENMPGGGLSNPNGALVSYYPLEVNLLSLFNLSTSGVVVRTGGALAIAPVGSTGSVWFTASGSLGADGAFTYDLTNKALSIGGATVTTSHPVLSLTQTWNASGVTFTGYIVNITDTASAAGSLLMDLQVGSLTKYNIDKSGNVTAAGAFNKVTVTAPATGATLTIQDGKTLSYTEGTWTPTLVGTSTAGSPTYTIQVGSYEKIGRKVTARFTIVVSALGSPTGNLQVGGLPFTAANTANDNGGGAITYMAAVTLTASYTTLACIVASNTNLIALYELGSGVSGQAAAVGKFGAATVLEGTVIYHT